jgi:NAD(P)-dependent dehydrogenase (short-subunit alcohol dehydrogenase family)
MTAKLHQQAAGLGARRLPMDRVWATCTREVTAEACYQHFQSMGLEYGPTFQGITRLWRGAGATIAQVRLHESLTTADHSYQIHPVALDLGFQALLANTLFDDAGLEDQPPQVYMPVAVERCRVYGPLPEQIRLYAQLLKQDAHSISGSVYVCDADGIVALELQGVRAQALGSAPGVATMAVRDTLYQLAWSQLDPPMPASDGPRVEHASWLILTDAHGLGEALAAQLEQQGERCVLAAPATHYRAAEGRYWLNPLRPEDFRALLRDAFDPTQMRCRGIVHLWGLEQIAPDELTVAALERAQDHGARAVTHLIQALEQSEWRTTPRLWLATRGAQAVNDAMSDVALAQSPLWGLARVIAYEHASLWGGIIDLPPTPATDEAAQLCAEIWRTYAADQVALRDGQRYSPQLVRQQETLADPTMPDFRADGSYLITGGLGGLGLEVARWMTQHGARRLILMGRTALPARLGWSELAPDDARVQQIAAIRELEALGATVHLAAVDVADAAQLGAFLQTYQREGWPPIRGVIHAAGVIRDRTILQLDAATFDLAFKPKVAGAWLLHTLLRDAPLDFFVLFSSVASMLGSPSQGNYAAANAFLDALAQHRRAQGLPAVSINWGPWAEVGMAARLLEQGGRLGFQGLHSITPPLGLEALALALRLNAVQLGVVPIDWAQWFEAYPTARSAAFFAQIQAIENIGAANAEQASQPEQLSRAALLALEPPTRTHALEAYLCEQVARVLRLPLATLNPHQPLNSLGMDSLMAIELKNRIEVDLGSTLSVVTFLQDMAIEQLAGQLLDRIDADSELAPVAALSAALALPPDDEQAGINDLLANLDALSDADLDRLLDTML